MFWRSNSETLSDRAAIFIVDFSLIFLEFGRCDCPLEVCRIFRNFVKSCYPQQVPVTVNLGCFGNPTVKSSPIGLKFLLEFLSHAVHCFGWSDLRSELYFVSRKFMNIVYFLGDEILQLFLINFNLLIFLGHCWWPFWGLGRVVLICSVINFVRLIVPLFWYWWSIYRSVGFFISIERFFPR